ncbi:hypothetical protein CMT41_08615 [Colwellia sp. MT41]|uniref:hypothetical protein n=1 Tax=Colwellia sp. MT41 TaxID=58049 RepID=UPI0007177216|nr:hypothetical protein [Colwellia sp. MT41]ALO34769.1 hypothetical protein CMT41_08615 [Colwellia sp. MT41]
MNINVSSQYQRITQFTSNSIAQKEPFENTLKSTTTDTVTISNDTKNKLERTTEIMAKYDLRNMSHNTLEKMSDELRNSGLMSDHEYLMMVRPSNNMEGLYNIKNDPNQSIDMIAKFEELLDIQKRSNSNPKFIDNDQKRLDSLMFFESLQS